MTLKRASGMILLCTFALAIHAEAKSKAAKKVTGLFCEQGSRSLSFGASQFKPNVRNQMRVGQKIRINVAGVGPLNCRVY